MSLKKMPKNVVKLMSETLLEKNVIPAIQILSRVIHVNAVAKGFWPSENDECHFCGSDLAWDGKVYRHTEGCKLTETEKGCNRNAGEMIALIHSECSELLEAVRKPWPSDHIEAFTGEEEECADIIIRVLDYAYGRNLRVAEALVAKHYFNTGREFKHGKGF